jgi:hypothetical protein
LGTATRSPFTDRRCLRAHRSLLRQPERPSCPELATRWSHEAGREPLEVVPFFWQATCAMLLRGRWVGHVRIATWNMAADKAAGGRGFLASLCCEVLLPTEVPPDLQLSRYQLRFSKRAMARGQVFAAVATREDPEGCVHPHLASVACELGDNFHGKCSCEAVRAGDGRLHRRQPRRAD